MHLANGLLATTLPCLSVLAETLSAMDYHAIRENLGLTSGSHSVALHYHLFEDLYEQLWRAVVSGVLGLTDDATPSRRRKPSGESISRGMQMRTGGRDTRCSPIAWSIGPSFTSGDSCISTYRGTTLVATRPRSLTGSPDAIATVERMRPTALEHDPMAPLAQARGLPSVPRDEEHLTLRGLLNDADSLDNLLLRSLGEVTKRRFPQVQDRTGAFAGRCPFIPPPPRIV